MPVALLFTIWPLRVDSSSENTNAVYLSRTDEMSLIKMRKDLIAP